MRYFLFIFLILFCSTGRAQEPGSEDTLETVIVNAYAHKEKLLSIAAPVNVVTRREFELGNEMSIVSGLTMLPGVNMEERSPGSYRINIRGSSQRSPFGVRNVKIYYQGIPMTDPGGSTYLQILGPYNVGSVEVLKGPSGSLYGTGTGGVLLINDEPKQSGIRVSGIYGSNQMQNYLVSGSRVNDQGYLSVKYNRQSSNGDRHHTAMHRDVIAVNGALKAEKNWSLDAHFLYGALYYQTPGALTLTEFKNNPMDARPHVGNSPSADEARAAFHVDFALAGFRFQQKLSPSWDNELVVYGAYGQNRNPNFRNYSRTSEPNAGGRINFHYFKKESLIRFTADLGGEYQSGWNGQRIFDNNGGETGALQSDDEIKSKQAFVYVQGKINFGKDWSLTAGSSLNFLTVDFQRFSGVGYKHHRNLSGLWMPRLAISKSLGKKTIIYAAVSRGFSPPSTSELLPSTNVFDTRLQAEQGTDFEIGWRTQSTNNRFYADVSLFHFGMKNTIVQERDSTGGDFFINAGSTTQNGIEGLVRYMVLPAPTPVFNQVSLFFSATIHDFKFKDYQPLDKDYSGNKLPGTEPVKLAADVEMEFRNRISLKASALYQGRIALNDANAAFASPYTILNVRLEYNVRRVGSFEFNLFGGSDNLTDATYSLGNDINAFGGRYYNAAPGRTFFVGVAMNLLQGKSK